MNIIDNLFFIYWRKRLASMRWNPPLPDFGLIAFTDSLLLLVECREKKFQKGFIGERILT
jgi:hypothetical protein